MKGPETVVDLLTLRAEEAPDRGGYVFLDDGERESGRLTFRALEERSRRLAARLRGVAAFGERALLLFPPGLDFPVALLGCMRAGLPAVPVPPPDPARLSRTLPRVLTVVRDSRPTVVLTTREGLRALAAVREEQEELAAIDWLAVDDDDGTEDVDAADSTLPGADDLAYLQYTSGSTAAPKGVRIRHRDLLANSECIRQAWGYDRDSVAVMWVPSFHDDGLVHGILQPLYTGFRSVLLPAEAVVRSPRRWLAAISHHRATHAGGPDFIYALAARKVPEAERGGLDLSSWRVAYNAAEPVRAATLRRFVEAFGPCGFRPEALHPSFGLAEATLLVSTGPSAVRDEARLPVRTLRAEELEARGRAVDAASGGAPDRAARREVVSCGAAVAGWRIEIVDPESGARLDPGRVGEIWIAGPSAADGYWERPEESRETFGARLADEPDAGPFLRTGDLGFLADGELYVTGRAKDVIIIRGRNIYPQDVEQTVEASHPSLRPGCGAAVAVEHAGAERVAVIHEVRDPDAVDLDAVIDAVASAVSEIHDVQLHTLALIPPGTLPKTSSGKVQRHACRRDLERGDLPVVARWTAPGAARGEAGGDRVDELLAWIRDYSRRRLRSDLIDERRTIPPHVVLDFGRRGLLGLQAARRHGGLGLGHRDLVRVVAQLGAVDLTLATFVIGHNGLGLRPIQRYASDRVRDELLPELARGRQLSAFALTEPGAGSNPLALAGKAVPAAGGGWRIHGTKLWIGSASWAGFLNVFAQLLGDDGAPRGITGFVVRQGSAGLRPGPEALTMGLRGMVQCSLELDGVAVGPEDVLGTPGRGLEVAGDAIGFTRLCLGAAAVGGVKRCLQLMIRYASRRSISTGPLLDNPATVSRLATLSAEVEALESLVRWVADALDRDEKVPDAVLGVVKTEGSELLWRAADGAVQLLGGRGYVETNVAARLLRDARVYRIFEGPTESLQMHLGALVERGDEELGRFLDGLGEGALRERLNGAAATCRERLGSGAAAGLGRVDRARWAHLLLGRAAACGILAAVAGQGEGAGSRGAAWAHRELEDALTEVEAGKPAEMLLDDREALIARARELAAEAGDVDQAAAGEDRRMDELLQPERPTRDEPVRDEPRPPVERATGAATRAPGPGAAAERREAEIRGWLVDWLADELDVDQDEIDPGRPFATHGLDSVVGVRLAEELGTWLGAPVDVTAAWEYPTIDALSRALGGGEPAPEEEGPTAAAEDERDSALARVLGRLEGVSDGEILGRLGSAGDPSRGSGSDG